MRTALSGGRELRPSRQLQAALLAVPRRRRRIRALVPLALPLAALTCTLGILLLWRVNPSGLASFLARATVVLPSPGQPVPATPTALQAQAGATDRSLGTRAALAPAAESTLRPGPMPGTTRLAFVPRGTQPSASSAALPGSGTGSGQRAGDDQGVGASGGPGRPRGGPEATAMPTPNGRSGIAAPELPKSGTPESATAEPVPTDTPGIGGRSATPQPGDTPVPGPQPGRPQPQPSSTPGPSPLPATPANPPAQPTPAGPTDSPTAMPPPGVVPAPTGTPKRTATATSTGTPTASATPSRTPMATSTPTRTVAVP